MRMLLGREKFDREMDEEMRLHLELREKEQRENSAAPERAHTETRKSFGNALLMREASREAWGWNWLEQFGQDLRYALRMLRKNPAFATVAVLTLALGIGANTAIFSVVNAIFLRSLPYANANRIYVVDRTGNRIGGVSISLPIFLDWQKQSGLFEHLALLEWRGSVKLTGAGEVEEVPASGASTEFFPMLGVQPALGRNFRPEEGRAGGPHVVILSDDLWRNRFNADPNILGRAVTLEDEPFTVVGVLPRGFEIPLPGARDAQLWLPVQLPLTSDNPSNGGLLAMGLLKSGVTPAQAEAALTPPLEDLRRQYPKMFSPGERAHLEPLHKFLGNWAGSAPLLLFGAVGLVLLIACVNVANLTLARSATRQREMAIRAAIGARRGRIIRQLLTESVLLAVIGGALGLLACYASFQAILSLVPANIPHIGEYGIDAQVLVFAFLLSVVTGIVFGLAPAVGASRVELNAALKEASAQSGSGATGGIRRAMAASEVAISLVLLVGAALALESFARLTRVHTGFDPGNLLTFHVDLSDKSYDTPLKRTAFLDQALARLSALPGVESASMANILPLEEGPDWLFSMESDFAAPGGGEAKDADYRVISADYFHTLRIPLERGRVFAASDNAASQPVALINQTMAKMFWPGQDPVGRRIWIGKPMGPSMAEPAPRQIIGVVGDIRESSLAAPPDPTMYIPSAQHGAGWGFFIVRTARTPLLSVPDVRSAMHAIDADIPITQTMSMDDVISASMTDWRFHAILLGVFGALALVIAAIGVYGVISYSVAQRTHEIGIRLALGAQRGDVMRLVVGQGAKLAVIGIAIGIGAAYGLTRLMANMLYGVKPTDPLTFAGVAVLLLAVALLACYIPARRAMKVDPMVALRYE
jgi:putative ABC transport system permease protein